MSSKKSRASFALRAPFRWLLALCSTLFALPQVAEADFKKVEERTVGRWKLTAVVQTDTDYALCLVTTLNDLGEHLNISVERPKHLWSLAFAGRDVRLSQGVATEFEVTYAIDDNEPKRMQALPSASGRVFVQLGQDVAVTEPVRHGSRIAFETADGTHAFSLAGSSKALDALSECARQHLGFDASQEHAVQDGLPATNPFSAPARESSAAAAEGGDATLDPTSEAILQTLKTTKSPAVESMLTGQVFLDESHLTGYAEMLDSDSADWIDGYDALWKLPKAKVGFSVLANTEASLVDEFFADVSAQVQTACPSSGRVERPSELAPGIIGRLHAYCEGASSLMFILIHRPRGGSYLMTVMGDPGSDGTIAAEKYDEQIARVFIDRTVSQ
jgi:hypothetical protein